MMHTVVVRREFQELGEAPDRITFESKLVAMAQALEFDIASAAIAVDRPGEEPIFEMIGNAPQEWTSAARDPKVLRRDPVLRRLRESSVPFIYDQGLYVSEGAGDVWEMQAAYGFKTGIAMAMHLPGGKHFLLGVDRSQPLPESSDETNRMVSDIALLTIYAQEVALRVLLKEQRAHTPVPRLSEREIEILKWTKDGKSAWETGRILSVSEKTVRAHLENIRNKMGVSSKHQAVLRALSLGLLSN
jgi:DNA-binding CsgD family transcriptional regulator